MPKKITLNDTIEFIEKEYGEDTYTIEISNAKGLNNKYLTQPIHVDNIGGELLIDKCEYDEEKGYVLDITFPFGIKDRIYITINLAINHPKVADKLRDVIGRATTFVTIVKKVKNHLIENVAKGDE